MTASMHPDDLIHRLRLDRRRCFIITGRPREGKTRLARQMAARYDGRRLDLLAHFAADPELTASVDTFTPRRWKTLLQSHATGDLILVDEMEFLWHCWDETAKRECLSILRAWSKPAFFGVFLTPDPVIQDFQMFDQDNRSRIFSLHDVQSLG